MTDFVMVAGAWLGAWAWDEVAGELRASGHGAHPLSLSGLAERQGQHADQRTHVQDIVTEVERLGLRDVVLVGHSYSGVPVGQAAERIGERLRRVVFVDSDVPVNGASFLSGWPSEQVVRELEENDGFWPPRTAEGYAGQGLTDEQRARLAAGGTPHPGATLTEPAVLERPLAELPGTYIQCLLEGDDLMPSVARLVEEGHWELMTMDTGHWPMVSRPRELAGLLATAGRDREAAPPLPS
ncbi:alpha/beta fold hydrolase [Streptomyces sp. NPDC088789]|uniref:alpha/beta fold hydrolase n=1 Tax=Streptomyces sp. NPDC088789 TaxID=3365899 RepID=UPI003828C36E